MLTEHEDSPAHHYRAKMNPEFIKRVRERQHKERMAAIKAEQARERQEKAVRAAAERAAREQARKEAEEFRATEEYRIIVVNEAPEGKTTARSIIEMVARGYGVTYGDIVGRRRGRHVVSARKAAIKAVAQARPDMTLPMIGKAFGNRDHTTIMYALDRKSCRPSKDAR